MIEVELRELSTPKAWLERRTAPLNRRTNHLLGKVGSLTDCRWHLMENGPADDGAAKPWILKEPIATANSILEIIK